MPTDGTKTLNLQWDAVVTRADPDWRRDLYHIPQLDDDDLPASRRKVLQDWRNTGPYKARPPILASASLTQTNSSLAASAETLVRPTSSAGIYDSDGKLVRTLWSAETNHASVNDPGAFWDGRLDDGSVAPSGDYVAKVLKHNIQYTWEGVIGNTSPDHLNNIDYHNYASAITDMAITDAGEIYFTHAYDERWNTTHVATESNIQEAEYVQPLSFRSTYGSSAACCTDGTYTYFVRILDSSQSWVHAVATAAYDYLPNNRGLKQRVAFASGTAIGDGQTAIGYSATGQFILDIAVQKSGNFLFISRFADATPTGYRIWTLNKTTGATLQTNNLSYLSQGAIATSPTTGRLWVIHSSTGAARDKISELVADGAGVLTETGVHITGLTAALGLEVSPDGSYILVTDGGSSQQIKAFNTSDGSVKTAWGTSGVFGTAGGYVNSPLVTDTKFMFAVPTGTGFSNGGSFIAFSSDSSFWVGDAGNFRNLHFSSGNSPTLIERIAYVTAGYDARECRGDPTRIFYEAREWEVDYDVAMGIDNGSWTLKRNWAADLPEMNVYRNLKFVGVYSNGRTYGLQPVAGVNRVYELTTSGLRDTGARINQLTYVDRNFDLWCVTTNVGGGAAVEFRKIAFTGFDGSENPTWASDPTVLPSVAVLTTETLPAGFPVIEFSVNHSSNLSEPLQNGVIPIFNAHSFDSTDYHFGGIDSVTGEAMFKTHPGTTNINYGGPNTFLKFPEAPFFPSRSTAQVAMQSYIGNGTSMGDNGGGSMFYVPGDRFVFTQFAGEEYGNNQSNVWSHWHQSGLIVSEFGPVAPYFALASEADQSHSDPGAAPPAFRYPTSNLSFKGLSGMAGNAFNGGLTYVNGKYYLYNNDEWYHAGIHRWRVEGLDTFLETDLPVTWNGSYTTPVDANNLLLGLPFDTVDVPTGSAGWVRSPVADSGTLAGSDYYRVYTNALKPNLLDVPDLVFMAVSTLQVCTLSRTLPRTGSGNWTIDAEVVWLWATNSNFTLSILDGAGKRIVRLTHPFLNALAVNGTPIMTLADSTAWAEYVGAVRPLTISANVNTGKMSVTFGDYTLSNLSVDEAGADPTDPATFRIKCDSGASDQGSIAITALDWSEEATPPVVHVPSDFGTVAAWFQAYDNTDLTVNRDGTGGAPTSGGVAGRWLDISGNGNHVSALADTNRPVWRTDNGLNFRALNAVGADYSNMRNTSTTAMPRQNSSGGMLCSIPGGFTSLVDFGTVGNGYAIQTSNSTDHNSQLAVHDGAGFGQATDLFTNARRAVVCWRSNGTDIIFQVNGSTFTRAIAGSAVDMTSIFFGTFNGGAPKPIRIFEAVFYSEDIGAFNLTRLDTYFRDQTTSIGDPTRTVTTVGDSLTQGSGSALGKPWPDYVTSRSGSVWYSEAVEGGLIQANGSYHDINAYGGSSENVVIIWAGTNDIITNNRTGAEVESDIQTYIGNLTGSPKIVICTLQAFTTHNASRLALNTLLKANYTGYADALVKLDEAPELSDSTDLTYYQADGVHLTDAGYAIVGGLVQAALFALP